MKLDYFTLLSGEPIRLSNVGTLVPPKLIDIRKKIGIDTYNVFLSLLKLTPKKYYVDVCEKTEYWDALTEQEKEDVTLYDTVLDNTALMYQYIAMFSFFFKEDVFVKEYSFILLNPDVKHEIINDEIQLKQGELVGIINSDSFNDILKLICQICYIQSTDEKDDESKQLKFKNKLAEKMWKKMQNSNQKKKIKKDNEKMYSIGNIISSVAHKDSSLNIISVWNLTVFQLYDQFTRIKFERSQGISDFRVSAWGDEKKQYKDTIWCTNFFEKD